MLFTRVEDLTGRIISTESYCEQADIENNQREGTTLYEGVHDGSVTFFDKKTFAFTDRPVMEISTNKMVIKADGVDSLEVTGLPKGITSVSIDGPIGAKWDEKGRSLSLTVDIPGTYYLQLSQAPYITTNVTFYGT